jgi:hypothetical protein
MDKSPFWFSSLPRLGAARQGWKKPVFLNTAQWGILSFGFLGGFWVSLYICPEEIVLSVISVSRAL